MSFAPIERSGASGSTYSTATANPAVATGASSFRSLLEATTAHLTFSAHAIHRLQSRNMTIAPTEMKKLSDAVDAIAAKGGREALILMRTPGTPDTAFVVSVKNRTVITAVPADSLKENIFTNIDSAALVS